MSWSSRNAQPDIKQKLVGAGSYLTGGVIGILYALLTKQQDQSYFSRFTLFQSVVLAILGMLLSQLLGTPLWSIFGMVSDLTSGAVPNILGLVLGVILFALGMLLPAYGAVMALMGKTATIPYLTPIIERNLR